MAGKPTMINPDVDGVHIDTSPPYVIAPAEELKAMRDSVADAASVSGALWITYLGMSLYLLIAIGSVTYKDLFLQSSMKLPFMNVDLPVSGFFSLGPPLFVILHAYTLLHFVILADKIVALNRVLETLATDQDEQRRQLSANIFVQFLAGPSEVRDTITGMFLWLIALVSIVIGPSCFCCFSN